MSDQQPQQDLELSIDLKVSEINLILAALDELPRKISNPIFASIEKQSLQQIELFKNKT
jgi:hypothetical protein